MLEKYPAQKNFGSKSKSMMVSHSLQKKSSVVV